MCLTMSLTSIWVFYLRALLGLLSPKHLLQGTFLPTLIISFHLGEIKQFDWLREIEQLQAFV